MSKTPRTDEHLRMKEENGHTVIVSRDFARQLETELVDKEKQLAEARAEIEALKAEIRDNNNLAAKQIIPAEMAVDDLRAELERKGKLIEQMRQAIEIGLESTRELLHEFDKKHGRTTPKNRLYTERWEAQIKQMETALEAAERRG